eukprot:3680820-Rhodomonas_salina.3
MHISLKNFASPRSRIRGKHTWSPQKHPECQCGGPGYPGTRVPGYRGGYPGTCVLQPEALKCGGMIPHRGFRTDTSSGCSGHVPGYYY